jgi:hypothetical protein
LAAGIVSTTALGATALKTALRSQKTAAETAAA